jgi:hypothetical protein
MMRGRIWKVALLNWVLLTAAAGSSPNQPNWQASGSYTSATDCVAAIGAKLAAGSVVSGIAGWASSALGAASGSSSQASNVAPMVCLPSNHPWVTSAAAGTSSGAGATAQPTAPSTP